MKPNEQFAHILADEDITGWQREYKFHSVRRWRVDFAFIEHKLAIEIEGGVWVRGRHVRGKGFISDCEKYNELSLMDWRLLRFVPEHIDSGYALYKTCKALEIDPPQVLEFAFGEL